MWNDLNENSTGEIEGYVCEWDVYEVEVEKKEVSLKKGKKSTISYTVYDAAGHTKIKNADVTFKSSNKKVAKVSKTGKIIAKKPGKCTITVKYKDATAKVKVTVTKK